MIFNINFDAWKRQVLPPQLAAKTRLNDLLLAGLNAAKLLHEKFLLFREKTLYKLRWTSQTIYLEKLLNDRFNNGNPAFQNFELRQTPVGIYIAEPAGYNQQLYHWNKAEERHDAASWLKSELDADETRTRFSFNEAEMQANLDFVVKVPIALFDVTDIANAVLLANMRAWIELYRIAGSRYEFQNY